MATVVLKRIEKCIKSLRPDTSATAPEHILWYEVGFRAAKRAMIDLLDGIDPDGSPDTADECDPTVDTQLKSEAYTVLRIALCDIEGGVAYTLQEAKQIAERAVLRTPPII
jgi:hypothetical protein